MCVRVACRGLCADGWDFEVALILNSFLLSALICLLDSDILLCESDAIPDLLPWLRQVRAKSGVCITPNPDC